MLTLTYFMARSNFVMWAFPYVKVKTVDFSETIAPSDLKGSRSRHLIEYMKKCDNRRSRSFVDLGPRSCTYKIQTAFSQKLLCRSEPNFV